MGLLAAAVPILPSADLDRSRGFYGYLGFRVVGQSADYLRMAFEDVEVHLYLADGVTAASNPGGWYLRTGDSAGLRERWGADGVDCVVSPMAAEYGATDFVLVDPDGNMLRVGPLSS